MKAAIGKRGLIRSRGKCHEEIRIGETRYSRSRGKCREKTGTGKEDERSGAPSRIGTTKGKARACLGGKSKSQREVFRLVSSRSTSVIAESSEAVADPGIP